MRLVTYSSGSGGARLGVLVNRLVVAVERFGSSHGLALPNDMLSFIDNSVTLLPALKDLLASAAMRGLDPQEWLWPGDIVEAGVDGVGILRHPSLRLRTPR